MNFNFSTLDLFLIFIFILSNCVVAFSSRSIVRDFDAYASGQNEHYSGLTIVSSIAALACSASLFFIGMPEICKGGFIAIWMYFFTEVIFTILMVFIYIPKIIKIKTYSLHEYISKMYNSDKTIRFVFALCEIIQRIGRFAVQIKIIGIMAQNIFGLENPDNSMLYVITGLLILYACFGGLKAVSHTDVAQSFIFMIGIPVIAFVLWHKTGDHSGFYNILNGGVEKFRTSSMTSSGKTILIVLSSTLFKIIGWPIVITLFQRVRMCKEVKRAQKLWGIGMIAYLLIILMITFIGVQLAGMHDFDNNADQNTIIRYMLDIIDNDTLSLLFFFCIVSLAFSTSDSEFNGISVLCAGDIFGCVFKKWHKSKLAGNVASTIACLIALALSLNFDDIFKLYFSVSNIYYPIAGMPLFLTIMGFKTYLPAIKIGSIVGFVTTAACMIISKYTNSGNAAIFSFGPGMVASLIAILLVHYYYKNVLKKEITCITQEDFDSLQPTIDKIKIRNKQE